jgi:hypothetical protein
MGEGDMTLSLTLDLPNRTSLSDVDWSPAAPTAPRTSEGLSGEGVIFGSQVTPSPTDECYVAVKIPAEAQDRMEAALSRIRTLAQLESNWDSYNGAPLQASAVLHTARLLAAIFQYDDVPLPAIVPTSAGGLQLEWHRANATLEMEVSPDKNVEVFLLTPGGRTWEGRLANSRWRLGAFLSYLASKDSPIAG